MKNIKNKKNKIFILVLLTLIAVISICLFVYITTIMHKKDDNIEEDLNATKEENEVVENIENNENNNLEIDSKYVDDNPIVVGLYVKEGNYKKLVKDYYCGWDPEEVLGIFYAVYTNEEQISGSNFNLVWKDYLNKYSDVDKYMIGYNLKFTMNDGTVIDQTILNPDHAYLMYPEIQCYLYDDINLVPGKRYYHITSEEMNDNTICSSIKLVGDKKTPNISSKIELTVFTYKSNDDFGANGKYRGNSKYTVTIYRKK